MPITNSGRRNASEPGTHMRTPAAAWSSRAESSPSRGTLGVVGIKRRSENVSRADRSVFCTSARIRYGNSSQGDQRGRLGYGRTTGYQNSSAVPRKQMCCR